MDKPPNKQDNRLLNTTSIVTSDMISEAIPKVSMIVPVYNVEDYLDKSLNSLVNQTLREIEIIVVDDGATDGSASIIEKYAKSYPGLIKAYKKPNGGLSDARNYGLQRAAGHYIGFLDSDDYVDPTMLEDMYLAAVEENLDIVECNLRHTYEDYEDIEIGREITDPKELLMVGRSVVWNKLYRHDWLKETGVTFSKGLIYEDLAFFLKLIPYIELIGYVPGAYVHYVQRRSSINNGATLKTLDIIDILHEILTFYKERDYYAAYQHALEFFFARILLCSSFLRMTKIKKRNERELALQRNWACLNENFPRWRYNPYLKTNRTRQGYYMRTVNSWTYEIYGGLLRVYGAVKSNWRSLKE